MPVENPSVSPQSTNITPTTAADTAVQNAAAVTAATTQPEIHVTPAVIDRGPQPPPAKPGSAKDRMFGDLRKKSGLDEPETPPAQPKPVEPKEPEADNPEVDTPDKPPVEVAPEPGKKKPSPWKLLDEHKAARLKAEAEIAELRKTMAPPEKLKELETKAAEYEKRMKELDEHIKYVDYTKSSEFQEKYQKPYEDAWQKWMGELGELTVQNESGQERPLAPTDLLELVNLPLQKAREAAEERFGNFADDVMAARKDIRSLFESQQKALEDAKKNGSERIAAFQKQMKEQQEALHKEITQHWQEANKAATEDPNYGKYFKPVEGDTEGNTRLTKGYEMADRAFSVNPNDPRLTAEQRAEVVRLHAAIRNRAAGFGRLAYQNSQLEAKVKELTATLEKYRGVEPGAGEPRQQAPAGPTTAKDSVFGALRKLAT